MKFSELQFLVSDTGLEWDGERLALHGVLYDYPIVILDVSRTREYLLTVFCKMRSDMDGEVTRSITALLDKLPANCVIGRKNELHCQQFRLNANLLYQENLSYLAELTAELPKLLKGFELAPEALDEAVAFPPDISEAAKPAKAPRPKDSVSKRFDKYSLRGFIGAVVGAAAMTALSGLIDVSKSAGTASMMAGWTFGGLIALVVLMDYRFLARKMDIFGTLSCSLLTALACVFGASWNTLNIVVDRVKLIDPHASVSSVIANWDLYQLLFPNSAEEFPLTLIKFLFTATVASALFYTVYYRRHSAIMYSQDGDFIPKS